MASPTTEFFEHVGDLREPLLRQVTASVRFDLEQNGGSEHWLLNINKGRLAASRNAGKADVSLRLSRQLFDRIVTGQANATAAALRGQVAIDGDLKLVVSVQRIFPGPPPQPAPAPIPAQAVSAMATTAHPKAGRTGR